MLISGWGRFPVHDAECVAPRDPDEVAAAIRASRGVIARGLGRSYGDSSLANRVLSTRYLDRLLEFDDSSGRLRCEAGVSLQEILTHAVPRGWFLPVTPGTQYVTVGGAIASDVHGKNHHVDGSFTDHVESIDILLGDGERTRANRDVNADLFHATCGGMGLTGLVVSATLRLRQIRSSKIVQTTFRVANLDAAIESFDQHLGSSYSVAWIDCLAKGRDLGRSVMFLGEHSGDADLEVRRKGKVRVPCEMPSWLLNPFTVKAFNELYYRVAPTSPRIQRVSFADFFYPLDSIASWNRLYGRLGFLQYQVVIPKEAGPAALRELIERIAKAGLGSFLAVLKLFGDGNDNLLSFPQRGYTLALDFQAQPSVFALLADLDRFVLNHGGRIYLAKDARMSKETFRAGYPRWQEFEAIRVKYHAIGRFSSMQSQRLGLA
jgi:FAD/FMN-containing dehydrogenase